MPPARLSSLDASFLTAETRTAHMHVGWVAVFDPPTDGDRPTFAELRDHMADRLDRAPRYRQRLASVPFGVHDPVWVDDEDFEVDRHVLRAPGTNLDTIVSMAMSAPLERSRPLWECWVAPRLDDGRIGVVGKAHHCMVDGLAAVELAALLLDGSPRPPDPNPSRWRAQPGPGALSRLATGALDRTLKQIELVRKPLGLLASPGRIGHVADDAYRALSSVADSLGRPAQPTPALNPQISPLRHLARIARPMDDLVRIKSHFGTTINDVVLSVCSGGVRRFLESHDEQVVTLKAMMPVALRSADEASGLGNRISFLFVDLPCEEHDPVRQLRTVNGVTTECKQAGEAEVADMVLNALGYAPHVVQRMLTRLIASPRTFNLVVSNIPGPREPMWMRGCELREVYPIVPLAERHALAIGVTSLPDGAFFGLYADRKMLPDADQLAACIEESIDELLAACDSPPPPDGDEPRPKQVRERQLASVGS